MAVASGSGTHLSFFFFISLLLLGSFNSASSEAPAKLPPIVDGLSWNFYSSSCPTLETIVRTHLQNVFKLDNGQAPGLLRIFFHDCFVQGCDGSILLDGNPNEKDQGANIGIRKEALTTIENLRALVHKQCGRIVSCADLVVLAAREAVFLSGGPNFPVPLGRKDSTTFSIEGTGNLPGPSSRVDNLLNVFGPRNFDLTDVVALSGAHTFGRAHCGTVFGRINQRDPPIDPSLNKILSNTCPSASSPNTVLLDVTTPVVFDNVYYVNLLNRKGVFTSDQVLFSDTRTKTIVRNFASNQTLFFEKFGNAIIKLSQLDVLTGTKGQVRAQCNVPNKSKASLVAEVVEDIVDFSAMR